MICARDPMLNESSPDGTAIPRRFLTLVNDHISKDDEMISDILYAMDHFTKFLQLL